MAYQHAHDEQEVSLASSRAMRGVAVFEGGGDAAGG